LKADSENRLTLAVEPYELVALRLENPVCIVGGEEGVSRAAMEPLLETFTRLKARVAHLVAQHVPQKPDAQYVWREAEQWDKWEAENQLTSDRRGREQASGRNDIVLDGDEFPVVYHLEIPATNRYALWVRHTLSREQPLYSPDWSVSLDGEEVGEWMSPRDDNVFWVSAGVFELTAGTRELALHYRSSGWSLPLDLLLLTTDLEYVPRSRANPDQRLEEMKALLGEAEAELRSRHSVAARARLAALEAMAK
jgi:hypothetical protein